MKKVLTILAVLALAAPAMAQVTFNATDNMDGTCTIDWASTGDGVVGMAVVVDAGTDVIDSVVEITSAPVDSFFDIYIDLAYDMETATPGSYTYGAGTVADAVADPAGPGVVALPQSTFVVSIAGLGGAATPLAAPPTSGTIKLASTAGVAAGTLTLDDGLRGPVVGLNGALTSNLDGGTTIPFTITADVECYAGQPDYAEWVAAGKPECWCYPRQCHGDANGTNQGSIITGFWYVGSEDLTVLANAWQVKDPPQGPGISPELACADFNHARQGSIITGYWRVGSEDLGRLATYWQVKEAPQGTGVPADCLPGNVTP